MKKIKYYIDKYKILLTIFILILLLIIILITKMTNKNTNKIEIVNDKYSSGELILEKDKEEPKQENINIDNKEEKIKVDIKGLVENPGVYEFDKNSRVIDVVNAAGGLKENANTEYINLSKKLTDEMIIIIYSNSDVDKFKIENDRVIYIEYECVCPDNKNDACITNKDTVNTNGVVDKDKTEDKKDNNIVKDDKISINTASLEEIMTIKGIGESKAKSIIEYREKNGDFKNIEDIKNVSGIGESVYNKIKEYIKL